MGGLNNDDLIEFAYQRLEGLDIVLNKKGRGPVWTTLWHEYVDLYNEVENKDFDTLRKRFDPPPETPKPVTGLTGDYGVSPSFPSTRVK